MKINSGNELNNRLNTAKEIITRKIISKNKYLQEID